MPLCKCSHSMTAHEWKVRRRYGYCQQQRQCGCAKFCPETDQPKPINKLLGKKLYGKQAAEKPRLMTPKDFKRRVRDETDG